MNNKIKILHLEDSLNDSELVRSLIESGGIVNDYFFVDNVIDYINILENENIDIILSDYSLPDYHGNEALKVARETYSYIPFIFVSGTIGEDAAIESMLNGATDYVLKDKLERLVPAIKRALHENELVTKHKLAEEKLIASETRYRRLFESAKDGILILNAETGMIVDVNPFLIDLLGYSHEEFLGKTIWDIGFFKDIFPSYENFLELQQKEYIRYEDLKLKTLSGRGINVEFVSNVYLVNSHKVIQCNIRDITDRKKAEDELRLKNMVFEASIAANSTADNEGIITHANPAFIRIWGYDSIEEVIGKPVLHFLKNEEEAVGIVTALNKKGAWEGEYTALKKNGTTFIAYGLATTILNEKGEQIGIQSAVLDITKQKKAEEELEKLKDDLEIKVIERTEELQKRISELERFHKATIGRELRMAELRKEIKELKKKVERK